LAPSSKEFARFARCAIAEALPEKAMQISKGPKQLNAGGTNFCDIGKVREVATGILVCAQKDFAGWRPLKWCNSPGTPTPV
jgi:hypothetical protein